MKVQGFQFVGKRKQFLRNLCFGKEGQRKYVEQHRKKHPREANDGHKREENS